MTRYRVSSAALAVVAIIGFGTPAAEADSGRSDSGNVTGGDVTDRGDDVHTVEFANGVHYNGHPQSQTIGHWLVAKGYYNYGDGAYFADPSTSVWSAANEEVGYATATFANRFLQNNGITW